jgi:hypothetical protein
MCYGERHGQEEESPRRRARKEGRKGSLGGRLTQGAQRAHEDGGPGPLAEGQNEEAEFVRRQPLRDEAGR